MVFFISIARVIGPTPPGTGVIQLALSLQLSKSTCNPYIYNDGTVFYHIAFKEIWRPKCSDNDICVLGILLYILSVRMHEGYSGVARKVFPAH